MGRCCLTSLRSGRRPRSSKRGSTTSKCCNLLVRGTPRGGLTERWTTKNGQNRPSQSVIGIFHWKIHFVTVSSIMILFRWKSITPTATTSGATVCTGSRRDSLALSSRTGTTLWAGGFSLKRHGACKYIYQCKDVRQSVQTVYPYFKMNRQRSFIPFAMWKYQTESSSSLLARQLLPMLGENIITPQHPFSQFRSFTWRWQLCNRRWRFLRQVPQRPARGIRDRDVELLWTR